MTPDRGGPELPAAPTCGPADHLTARQYQSQLQAALDQDGWSTNQRAVIRAKLRLWTLRAAGLDQLFEKRGNIPGHPDSLPPTTQDIVTWRWKRAHQAKMRAQTKATKTPATIHAQELADDKSYEPG